jgi:nucleoside triphosphate pyrophosphatase
MLILASGSPRRAELLTAAGIAFEVLPVEVDETPLHAEPPDAHVRRLAEAKARTVFARRPDATVLGADTVVVIHDRILGKPRNAADAAAMLRMLSGRVHEVLTGVAIMGSSILKPGPSVSVSVARTQVWFAKLSDEEIEWYVATGEPLDRAGAYAIQGLASRFVERIDGSYTNVVGLPVGTVYRMLSKVPGIRREITA